MEEKKLTDEEIIKALECCVKNDCEKCPYLIKGFDCVISKQAENDFLDLIHRLQDDYSNLKERYVKVLDLNEKVIADQKTEIERLTEEHERIAWSKQQYLDWVHGFLSTHTEMKDRGEKFKMFDREWMCNTFWAKIEGSLDYIIDLENQRNELQKQVDDLEEKLEKAYEIERANIQAEIAEAGTSCQWCKNVTAEDTAKEIFEAIFYDCWAIKDENGHRVFDEGKIKDFAKKCYGVELN